MWKIYVGNLSPRIREMELSKEFRPYGLVRSIWIVRNPPGYAFIEFDSHQEAHDAIAALDGKHGWHIEMSRRSSGGIRSSSHDTRCQECGSRHHIARDCRFRASQSSRRISSPYSRARLSRDSPKRRRSRSRSRQNDDQLNGRSPRNHEKNFQVKSECSRSPQNVQIRSSSACSAGINEDSPSQKICSSKYPQNDLIDPQTDGYHSSKEREYSSSPGSGSGRSPIVQKSFESDGPAVSEPDPSGSSEHMNCGNRPSPST